MLARLSGKRPQVDSMYKQWGIIESQPGDKTSDTLNSSIPGTSSFMLKHTCATEEFESIRNDSFKPQVATCCFLDLFNCP